MSNKSRLQYLDWMRGLAVVLMFETHVFDSFLNPAFRNSEWFWLSQFLGGMPAPMFLFLAGISLALVLDRLHEQNVSTANTIKRVLRRGGWILLLAYGFRIAQILEWYPNTSWDQLGRVDILNCIALSSLAAGLSSAVIRNRRHNALLMGMITLAIVLTTPLAFQIHGGVPAPILEYLNGFGGISHPNYFTFFSWSAFTFAGAAVGYILADARAYGSEKQTILRLTAGGIAIYWSGYFLNYLPGFSYGFFDYSLTSPQYFLVRLGYLALFLYLSYRWTTLMPGKRWDPLITFGQTSLLVYWIHIDFVYGRLRPFDSVLGIGATAAQLLWLVPVMLALSTARLKWFVRKPAAVH